jgi:hypothetical protein
MSLKIQNFDVQGCEHIDKHSAMPAWSFRMCLIGPSGSGKTNLLLNMLYCNLIHYDTLTLVAPSLEQPVYQKLQDTIHKAEEAKLAMLKREQAKRKKANKGLSLGVEFENVNLEQQAKIGNFIDDPKDVPALDSFDKTRQNLIIFDDVITEKNQDVYVNYFIRSRHRNCSVIYLSQSYFKIPISIRRNTTDFILFKIPRRADVNLIYNNHVNADITKDQFRKLYDYCTRKKYGFMYIDGRAENDHDLLRSGFDEYLLE